MMWSYVLKLVVLLPLVCGLMVGCLWAWRKLEARLPGQPATRMLRVAETMMISPAPCSSKFPGRAGRLGPRC